MAMLSYLAKRLVFGAVVLLGTSLLTFLIAFVHPAISLHKYARQSPPARMRLSSLAATARYTKR